MLTARVRRRRRPGIARHRPRATRTASGSASRAGDGVLALVPLSVLLSVVLIAVSLAGFGRRVVLLSPATTSAAAPQDATPHLSRRRRRPQKSPLPGRASPLE